MTPISLAAKYVDRFAEVANAVEPQHGSILPSEMLLFCAAAMEAGCETVVESGRRYGYSTEILARFHDWDVFSIEGAPEEKYDARFEQFENVTLVRGNGLKLVPKAAGYDAAVLLDGPKGLAALKLADTLNVPVIAIHDCYPHTEVREKFAGAWFTDEPEYVERFGWLDAATLKLRGYASHSEILPFAGVLGVRA